MSQKLCKFTETENRSGHWSWEGMSVNCKKMRLEDLMGSENVLKHYDFMVVLIQ